VLHEAGRQDAGGGIAEGHREGLWDVYDALAPEEQEQVRRELRAQHYGSLTFIDEQIGRVLDGLEARGELENTTIVFTSDHGSALFDNGMLHKGGHFPSQAIVPFVVWHPGTVTPGVRTNFSAHVDLYPTLMEIAGGAPHQGCEGTSIVPMLGDAKAAVKAFDVIECVLTTSIVTHKWIAGFNHYNEEVDLYDRSADPMCHHNIADDPANARVIDDLRGKLVAWRRNLSPDLDIPDDLFQWRECLGPLDVIAQFRKSYLGQYQQMSELDEAQRPGRVGKHVPAAYRSGAGAS
jgi:arylsulfatase A-like enzyme